MRKLLGKWNFYHHLSNDNSWSYESYRQVMMKIENAEECVGIAKSLTADMVQSNMLFVMRDGIRPMWEDPKNRNGGCFSYKVHNDHVHDVWTHLFFALCGESLTSDPNKSKLVNGITISPKKKFCIVKIWMCDRSNQDCSIIIPIQNLSREGCLFKEHDAE